MFGSNERAMTSFLVILLILFHFRISAKSNYKAAPYGMKNKNKKTTTTTNNNSNKNDVIEQNPDVFFFR